MDHVARLFVSADEVQACRVCLAIDVELLDLHSNNLAEMFTDLTRIPVSRTDGLPQHICDACCALLQKAAAFRIKCTNTHTFLQTAASMQPITMDYIRSLDKTHIDSFTFDFPSNCTESYTGNDIVKSETKDELDIDENALIKNDIFIDNPSFDDVDDDTTHNDEIIKSNDETAIIKKETTVTKSKKKTPTRKPKVLKKAKIVKFEDSDSWDTDDEVLVTKITRLRTMRGLDPEKQKLKGYINKCKQAARDNYKRTFYDYILNKYVDNPKDEKDKEEKVIDTLDSDNEQCFYKTEDNKIFVYNENVTEEDYNQFIANKNTDSTKKIFYDFVRAKYFNKKKPEEVKKIVDVNKVKVKLKRNRKGTSKEEFDKFARTYNFDIIKMSKEEQIKEFQAKREVPKYKNSKYKCEYCFRGYISEKVFKNHMAIHDPSNGPFVCEICRVRFKDNKRMLGHLRNHTIKFVCKSCNRHFWNSTAAKNHYKTHEGVEFECEHCGKIFSKYGTRVNHIRVHHGSTKCDICYATLQHAAALVLHKTKLHRQIFPCSICSRNFDNADALKRHASGSPTNMCNPQMTPCTKCGETFISEDLLKEHIKKGHKKPKTVVRATKYGRKRKPCCPCTNEERGAPETGAVSTERTLHHTYDDGFERKWSKGYERDEPYEKDMERTWPYVGYKVENNEFTGFAEERGEVVADVSSNMVVHGVKPVRRGCPCAGTDLERTCPCTDQPNKNRPKPKFMCEMCAVTFTSEATLRYHQLIHTGEKPHQCTFCEKRFRLKESLEAHVRIHTGDRPYKCPHCEKAFRALAALYRHRLVHTKERRHRCTYCEKMFLTSTCLKMHIRTVHMKIPVKPRDRNRKRKFE